MFASHTPSADLRAFLQGAPADVRIEVLRVYNAYADLLTVASRDREALLGFIDTVGIRLDDLPAHPMYANVKAIAATHRKMQGVVREALVEALNVVNEGGDLEAHVTRVLDAQDAYVDPRLPKE